MLESGKPVDIREVEDWLNRNFLSNLQKYGLKIGNGFEQGVFTGKGLCEDASLVIMLGLYQKYGEDVAAKIVGGPVRKVTDWGFPFINHARIHVLGTDRTIHTADTTRGQLIQRPTRIEIFPSSEERLFYFISEPPADITLSHLDRFRRLMEIAQKAEETGVVERPAEQYLYRYYNSICSLADSLVDHP